MNRDRSGSISSESLDSSSHEGLISYHQSARSIVFRDSLRRAVTSVDDVGQSDPRNSDHHFERLPLLEVGPDDDFHELKSSPPTVHTDPGLSDAESHVVQLLCNQQCVVKTVKNIDWSHLLHRFQYASQTSDKVLELHKDIPPAESHHTNAFLTSTSLLPTKGLKMRCFGARSAYTVGLLFELPTFDSEEQESLACRSTETWAWPAGYSAKTEFNIDGRGNLINGRKEKLMSLEQLRQLNNDYVHKQEYLVGDRLVRDFKEIPYNELYLRVGGSSEQSSLERGLGLPKALFIRSTKYGHLISMLRTRSRLLHVLGVSRTIPLLVITAEKGVQVLTDNLQKSLFKIAAQKLNPFQNSAISYRTTIRKTEDDAFQQKLEELFEFDESIQETLTPEELAHIAGGFGATDESVALMLQKANERDVQSAKTGSKGHSLQHVVNEGLASALRSGDYHTSRQLLILYSLVSARSSQTNSENDSDQENNAVKRQGPPDNHERVEDKLENKPVPSANANVSPVIPPPLDTDRLRSATNSDGLLAVLGAAQVLRAMKDGSAKSRVMETIDAVNEWVNQGEDSVAFRISSWYGQRAAQGNLKIAMPSNSNIMAFVSNKAIENRKAFAEQLCNSVAKTSFCDVRFLEAINNVLLKMHSPCLRLELLQYVLGLDNRYSVAHVARSVELAMLCLDVAAPVR